MKHFKIISLVLGLLFCYQSFAMEQIEHKITALYGSTRDLDKDIVKRKPDLSKIFDELEGSLDSTSEEERKCFKEIFESFIAMVNVEKKLWREIQIQMAEALNEKEFKKRIVIC